MNSVIHVSCIVGANTCEPLPCIKYNNYYFTISLVEKTKSAAKERRVQRHKKTEIEVASDSTLERRSLRKSTIDLAKERERHRQDEERRRHKTTAQSLGQSKKYQRLSQEQLLREAKRTEVKNLASLESYRLQSEKKSYKEKKHTLQGSIIRYHSMIMPTVALSHPTVTYTDSMHTTLEQPVDGKYSRNFIVFTDNDLYCNTFSYPCPTRPKRVYCPVTGLPAKYVDPLTKLPYATAQAFRIIRNRYVKEKEDKCEARIVQLNNWLEEKKKLKKQNC